MVFRDKDGTKQSEPLAQAPASSDQPSPFGAGPVDAQKTPPKPPEQQAPSAVTKAQTEQQPAKYDNAPPDVQGEPVERDPNAREPWGTRPTFEELKAAETFQARMADPLSAGGFSGGARITAAGVTIMASAILARGENFLRAMVADESIELKIASK